MTSAITLTALPALYDRRRRLFSIAATPDGQPPISATVRVRHTQEIAAAVARFGAAIRATAPGASFLVLVKVPRGERTPAGFRAAQRAGTFRQAAFMHAGTRRPPFQKLLRR
jgi:hypothetical protein